MGVPGCLAWVACGPLSSFFSLVQSERSAAGIREGVTWDALFIWSFGKTVGPQGCKGGFGPGPL